MLETFFYSVILHVEHTRAKILMRTLGQSLRSVCNFGALWLLSIPVTRRRSTPLVDDPMVC